MTQPYDMAVVGGGFYGCAVALLARGQGRRVVLIEREPALLTRASYVNQARVHRGYHYPRSVMTARRSAVNFPRFVREFGTCVDDRFQMIYAIARDSKVTADQFVRICDRIGAPVREAPARSRDLFDAALVERVFVVEEIAFDAVRLRALLAERLAAGGVDVLCGRTVTRVAPREGGGIDVMMDAEVVSTGRAVICAYAQINTILTASGLPAVPLKHEISELPLVEVPEPLRGVGVTVMDGPYFSTMPFPPRGLHSLHHVRYSPHESWRDPDTPRDPYEDLARRRRPSNFEFMVRDASRYLPLFRQSRQAGSLFEVKTVLPRNEIDDGRPIFLRTDYGLPGLSVVLGAKIDNVYDALEALGPA